MSGETPPRPGRAAAARRPRGSTRRAPGLGEVAVEEWTRPGGRRAGRSRGPGPPPAPAPHEEPRRPPGGPPRAPPAPPSARRACARSGRWRRARRSAAPGDVAAAAWSAGTSPDASARQQREDRHERAATRRSSVAAQATPGRSRRAAASPPQWVTAAPPRRPAAASSRLSVSTCPSTRARELPSASRIPVSRRRRIAERAAGGWPRSRRRSAGRSREIQASHRATPDSPEASGPREARSGATIAAHLRIVVARRRSTRAAPAGGAPWPRRRRFRARRPAPAAPPRGASSGCGSPPSSCSRASARSVAWSGTQKSTRLQVHPGEAPRRHADDGVRPVAEVDRAAQHLPVARRTRCRQSA